jgi:hypothetical protein
VFPNKGNTVLKPRWGTDAHPLPVALQHSCVRAVDLAQTLS